MQYEYSKVPPS